MKLIDTEIAALGNVIDYKIDKIIRKKMPEVNYWKTNNMFSRARLLIRRTYYAIDFSGDK